MSSELVNIPAISTTTNLEYQNKVNALTNFKNTEDALEFSKHLILSGVLPKSYNKPETVLVAMQMGKEIGLNAVSSIFGIDIIQGRPALSSRLMLALVWGSGCALKTVKDCEPVKNEKDEIVDYETIIRFYRPFNNIVIEEDVKFTYKEAGSLDLLGRDQWKKQYPVMMYWRAVAKGCRRVIPDKLAGIYHAHEVADVSGLNYKVTEDGEIQYI
jgi:hypothetical protein